MSQGNIYASGQSGRSKQARAGRENRLGTTAEKVKKGQEVLLAALEPWGRRRLKAQQIWNPRTQVQGSLQNSGHPFPPSHIFSREMISWFLNRSDAAALAVYAVSLLKQSDTITTAFNNPGYLGGEGDTLILQALTQPRQCLVCWRTQVSVTCISFFSPCPSPHPPPS